MHKLISIFTLSTVLLGFSTVSFADANRASTQLIRIFIKSLDAERAHKQNATRQIENVKRKRKEIELVMSANQVLTRDPSLFAKMPHKYKTYSQRSKENVNSNMCPVDSVLTKKQQIKKSRQKQK